MANILGQECYHFSDEEYIQAARKCHGIVTEMAKTLGTDKQVIRSKMKHNPELKKIVMEEREFINDLSQNVLIRCLEKDSLPAAMFALKTIGGWSENKTFNINATSNDDEEEYDLSVLTPEELAELERLNAKIYKSRDAEQD